MTRLLSLLVALAIGAVVAPVGLAPAAVNEAPGRAKKARAPVEGAPFAPTREAAVPLVTLISAHSFEAVAWFGESEPGSLRHLLRCRVTGRERSIDSTLPQLLARVAREFRAPLIEVVSGYRDEKFNEELRKKGRQVAQQSMHTLARAVDFRIPGTDTRKLRDYLWKAHTGGVGFYPESDFVHADSGPHRAWTAR